MLMEHPITMKGVEGPAKGNRGGDGDGDEDEVGDEDEDEEGSTIQYAKTCHLRYLLLLRGEGQRLGAQWVPGEGEGAGEAGRGPREGPRAAASVAVALGKLLRRCEGRLVAAMGRCEDLEEAREHADGALVALCGVRDVLVEGSLGTPFAHLGQQEPRGRSAGGGEGESHQTGRNGSPVTMAGAGGDEQQQEQVPEQEEQRWRVWVCAYGAWQWLPVLARLALRSAGAGLLPLDWHGVAWGVWHPLLLGVRQLCLRALRHREAEELGGGQGACGAGGGGGAACSGGSGGSLGAWGWCACWRDFLLRDVGAVGLLGTALRLVVPAVMRQRKPDTGLVMTIGEACVQLAAVCPEAVAQSAWGVPAGQQAPARKGSSSRKDRAAKAPSSSAAAWPPATFAVLADIAAGWESEQPVHAGLVVLGAWGGECVRQGRAVAPSAEQQAVLLAAAEHSWSCIEERDAQLDVLLVPPLCGLRALMRTCSNPGCVVLPPLGQTEAEAAERRAGCPGEGGAGWYCCRECRQEHRRAGGACT